VLGKGATRSQRIEWHREHQEHCTCRPIPKSLVADVRRGPTAKQPARAAKQVAKSLPSSKPAATPIERAFERIKAAFASDARVTSAGKGFGAGALKIDGKIFAMLSSKREFVVKLPRERVAELVDSGRGRYFDSGKGTPMKEWLAVDDSPKHWLSLAREAHRKGRGLWPANG